MFPQILKVRSVKSESQSENLTTTKVQPDNQGEQKAEEETE